MVNLKLVHYCTMTGLSSKKIGPHFLTSAMTGDLIKEELNIPIPVSATLVEISSSPGHELLTCELSLPSMKDLVM